LKRVYNALSEKINNSWLLTIVGTLVLILIVPQSASAFSLARTDLITEGSNVKLIDSNTKGFLEAALSPTKFEYKSARRARYAGTALVRPGVTRTVPHVKLVPKKSTKPAVVRVASTAKTISRPTVNKIDPKATIKKTSPAAPKASPQEKRQALPPQSSVNTSKLTRVGAGRFGYGYCTAYVAAKRPVYWLGNAWEWLGNAQALGFATGKMPRVGAILVTNESGWGHVAYVEWVNPDNQTFGISEQNYKGWNIVSTRTLNYNNSRIRGFIY